MSEPAHTVPGQSILERLYARGAVRPSIGATAAFYERFGLADPWTDVHGAAGEMDPEGMFFFLSAAPYYARLRAQRQREWRARRRLLMRLSEPMGAFTERAFQRLAGVGGVSAAWLQPKPRVSHMAWSSAAAMVPLVAAPVAEEEEVEEAPGRWRDRRGWHKPSLFKRREPTEVPTVLREILKVASGETRQVLVRVIREVVHLPAEEQAIVARRITRELRGPAARMAKVALAEAEERTAVTPLHVAAERARPAPRRTVGLRPMLASSPAMQPIYFEEPEVEAVTPPAARRTIEAPTRVTRPTAHREVPEARVVREARTQQVTGRAGPEVETAVSVAVAPVRRRRRPTERVATLASETQATTSNDSRYGLEAVRRPTRRGTARVALRASAEPARGSRGERLLSPSPTGFVRRDRTRPMFVAAPEPSYVEPIGLEPTEEPTTAPARRRAAPPREGAVRRAVERVEPIVEEGARPVVRRTRVEPVSPEARVVERVVRAEQPRPLRVLRVVAETERPGATMRAASRIEAARPEPTRRRVVLASRPTSYLEQVVQPVAAPEPEPAPQRRYGRPTVRAAARTERAARTDTRGSALLTTGPTDYLAVARTDEAEGPLSRSPIRRRMRGSVVDTDAVVRPVEPEAPAAEVPSRRAPTARAVERIETGRRTKPRRVVLAAPVTPEAEAEAEAPTPVARAARRRARVTAAEVATAAESPTREAILVRDARGQVRPSRRVATGAAAYASARLVTQATEEVREESGTERVHRRATTPLERSAASRRRALPRPMPHAVVARDFRWLMPEPLPEIEAPTPRRPVRVVAERRVTGAGPVSRERLEDVLARVSAVVRAVDRADVPRVLLPATRRTLEGARVTAEPRRRRLPTTGGEGIVLRVVVEEEDDGALVARAERRASLRPRDRRDDAPEAGPLRRALAGAPGMDMLPVERAAARVEQVPAVVRGATRRAAVRTLRTADGRFAPSAARLPADQRPLAFGRGRPGIPARRYTGADATAGAALLEAPQIGPEEGEARPRPLGRTLDYVQGERRPSRRASVAMEPLAAPTEEEEEAPAWAQRAVRGTAARRRRPADEAPQTVRTPVRGDLFTALARARRPEDVVQVILERGQRLRSETTGLPEPAVRLVERIVRVQEEVVPLQPTRVSPEGETLSRGRPSRSTSVSTTSLPRPAGGASPAAARRVTSLADKLMKLIHLAEVERKVAEAQREVRMAADTSEARAEAGHGETAAGAGAGASLKQLESDVLAAVFRELEYAKQRSLEDLSDVW